MASEQPPTLQRLNKWLAGLGEPYICRVEVEKFLAVEREKHPTDVVALADTLLASAVTTAAHSRLNQLRRSARRAALRDATDELAQALTDGTPPPGLFSVHFVVDKENTRKSVGQMTGKDHRFVADGYLNDARVSQMEAAFHRAVAKKVGDRPTAEVMSEETYSSLYRSIVRPNAA